MRILLVEDDPSVAAAIRRGLTAEGYDIDWANDGNSGLMMASEHRYGVIILDILLPGRNGYKVCSTLRSSGCETPILMLTAKSGEYDEAEGLDAGADDYLRKPFNFVVLSARVRALLRRPSVRQEMTVELADLEVDFQRRTCTRGNAPVHLTWREFAVLEALVHQQGRTVTKQHLLDEVWGPSFDGGSNVIEVYVSYLRKKLDSGRSRPLIQTVYGQGYRIVP